MYSRTSGRNFQFRCFFEQSISFAGRQLILLDEPSAAAGDDRGDAGVDGGVSEKESGN